MTRTHNCCSGRVLLQCCVVLFCDRCWWLCCRFFGVCCVASADGININGPSLTHSHSLASVLTLGRHTLSLSLSHTHTHTHTHLNTQQCFFLLTRVHTQVCGPVLDLFLGGRSPRIQTENTGTYTRSGGGWMIWLWIQHLFL